MQFLINSIALFGNVNLRKCFCEIHGYRYRKDAFLINFPRKEHLHQYRDLKSFYRENVGDEIMNAFYGIY